ncbi:type II secretion system F family protein [Methanobrevibacter sp. TMH8]|uniref:type II secretion system F family protein n=1 Tax=Methanobrevibacter sp. TMH8 TaxID=2848611 RepID=UPI001CC930B4|nr:type II secretion system F family protein [Methanobrevibacter sp. TMH8]
MALFHLLFKLFNSFFNSLSRLIFKNIADKDNNNDKTNNENKNSDFNEDNKSAVNIVSKLKNILFSNKDKNKDEIFIFKQLQLNSNLNKKNNNYNNYKDDSYWSKKYNIANNRIGSNIENTTNNDKNIQKGYLNNIVGKKIAEIINIKLFIPSVLAFIVILTILIYFLLGFEIAMAIILLFLMIIFGILFYPKMNKDKSRSEISKELPYALRQMVTELRSGKGLHDTISSIANSDYGALSFEFSRVIEEIKYGENTEKALINMSNRVSSDGLNRAVQQIVGTLRTGGNLASTLNIIAEDISYDLQIKLKDYSQKLNAFIMIYTFLAILGPVILLIMLMAASTVMGDIVPSNVVIIMYVFFFPMIVVFMGLMIKKLEPSL